MLAYRWRALLQCSEVSVRTIISVAVSVGLGSRQRGFREFCELTSRAWRSVSRLWHS